MRIHLPLALLSCSATLAAQQFQDRPLVLAGTPQWTEAVATVDADGDGRLDLVFARCNGWTVPGDLDAPTSNPPTQMVLVQTGAPGAPVQFADQSGAFLPANSQFHAKSVAVADFSGDGLDDLLFTVAFQAPARLYVKSSASGPWVDESFRLPALVLNAFHAGVGDLDDDGDLDLVIATEGPVTFGNPGAAPRVWLNNGLGFFTDAPAQLVNPLLSKGAQNAKLVDLDNDFDLDLIVDGKSSVTPLYLNDGAGLLTRADGVLPTLSGLCYETEWGDLDGDLDIDAVVMSPAGGLKDGTWQNGLVESGTLSFVESTATLSGTNGHDDNDFALLDANDDGRLDVIDASLGNINEKLYLNQGGFGAGFLLWNANGFNGSNDSTLDIVLGDFDADGDLDAVTGQGETGSFQQRYYENTGPADTRAPVLGRVQASPSSVSLSSLAAGQFARRAWIQDSLWDDGSGNVRAELVQSIGAGPALSSAMLPAGGQLYRGRFELPPGAALGDVLDWHVEASDHAGNTAVGATQSFVLCGLESYGTPNAVNILQLGAGSDPVLGQNLVLSLSGGAAGAPALLLVGFAQSSLPLFGGELLVELSGALSFATVLDGAGQGQWLLALPGDPLLEGLTLDLQAGALDLAAPQGVALSLGLEALLCGS